LSSFKKAFDHNNISEASAGLLLPYFMEGRVNAELSARMKQVSPSILVYSAVVHWLLQSFATKATITPACRLVLNARQTSDED
jgi:hypothetical protein